MCPANRDRNICVESCFIVKQLVPDELWMIIEPLLPPDPPKPSGGRPRVPERAALAGIIFLERSYHLPVHGFDVLMLGGLVRQAAEWRRGGA